MTRFTYPEIGATAQPDDLPTGYHHVHRHEQVGRGRADFEALAGRLMSWDVHRDAGLEVTATSNRPSPGVDVTSAVAIGPIRFRAPCRVVWTVDEPDRVGFAYGTLDKHPEQGEEAFVVVRDPDDIVWFTVVAFSRPRAWYAKLGGPVATRLQAMVTDRYIAAARRSAA